VVGNIYVLADDKIGLEYIVVKYHPDDSDSVFVVPMDTVPMVGVGDVPLENVNTSYVSRCGRGTWAAKTYFAYEATVGVMSEHNLSKLRQKLHELATGKYEVTDGQRKIEDDFEYIQYMEEVEKEMEKF
jgi:hypothetical protein